MLWSTFGGCSHPINEPLVKLLHGSLELATLVLPFLVVTHRLLRGSLPRSSSGYVVDIVNSTHWIHSALPPAWKERQKRGNHKLHVRDHLLHWIHNIIYITTMLIFVVQKKRIKVVFLAPCRQRLRSIPGCPFLNVVHIVYPSILVYSLFPPAEAIQINSTH